MDALRMRRLAAAFAAILSACGGGTGDTAVLTGSPISAPAPPPSAPPPPPPPASPPPAPAPAPAPVPPPASGPPTITEFSAGASLDGGSMALAGDSNVWFSGGFAPTRIGRITPAGVVSYPVTGAAALPAFATGPLIAGPDGNLWFADPVGGLGFSGAIGMVNVASGVAVEFDTPLLMATTQVNRSTAQAQSCTGGVCMPVAMGTCVAGGATTCQTVATGPTPVAACAAAAANAGNAFTITTCATTITPPASATACTASTANAGNAFTTATCTGITPGAQAYALASGPGGKLWFTEYVANRIGRFDIGTRVVTEYGPLMGPASAIVAGPDGNIWFVENSNTGAAPVIGRITPAGAITELTDGLDPGQSIASLTAGADGSLWFVKSGTGGAAIGKIAPATGAVTFYSAGLFGSFPALGAITAGPDGNVWFTDYLGGTIGRIAPDGSIGQFATVTPSSALNAITMGPTVAGARTVWFTEPSTRLIGRATLP